MNKHSDDINGGGKSSPSVGINPDALPEAQEYTLVKSSHTGVSTKNVPLGTEVLSIGGGSLRQEKFRHWYALRTTYGREKKAYEYLVSKNITAFYPTLTVSKVINGKRKFIEVSRLPNIFFAYGTEDEIKTHVYDNINLPYLRFYYRKVLVGRKISNEPLIVPDHQMESFRTICAADAEDIIISTKEIPKFKTGQQVRVIDGNFKGVTGTVARYKGQQRVAVVIDGLLTVVTAYIPTAFIKNLE